MIMKQETPITDMLTDSGPIAHGEIFMDEHSFLLNKNSQRATPFARVKLLIDTGSDISGIDSRIINGLRLNRYQGNSEVNGVGGIHLVNRYRCVLFLNIFGLKGLPIDVIEGNYAGSPYDGIIGREVLQYCPFKYHGPSNTFEIKALDF
jgi:hypothetical protein